MMSKLGVETDQTTQTHWGNLRSRDGNVRYAAFMALLNATEADSKYRKKYAGVWRVK
jgi:hypothetical protein